MKGKRRSRIRVEIRAPRAYQAPGRIAGLRRAARAVLRRHGLEGSATLTVALVDEETIHHLNRTYRGIDAPTDVLSFPTQVEIFPGVRYLGDVVIAFPYAARQAQREGHPLDGELALLTVHGVLHLLGYDHDTEPERHRMWAIQREILDELGFPGIAPTDEEESVG
ncbi:rRNA maturation RNase YbeY [Thermoflexus sp.]|uniref:rRNA maturation RNase YbeY n=1 Tax=Thermoflexus sp. TaxID=1969742 RepID=UPI0025E90782|nr:rRNA maturation RNase YbeY [Thermoflexus sp.]MDW8180951.1 rRNA maturation RNase YbeY [Anaerolineae bacterium]MCS6963973.1 rRNA maturation RNase YbeY [Thermoflexus sp.]MCS7351494.1 rRNA maturation RNase YbeY [Thermoflexus sp.]MCX7691063.1 rRNA maturation RNase YbeY [Thermoflexus sp.]MDW8185335.1 rRNA maturation RNase YbeY [Anaerolineae bacterium]